MDIPALKTFCRAVESGNLSTAAVALHITKSVASRRIRSLEDDLGVRLLRRSTRGVSTTPEGAQFYERASRILEDLDDARQALKGEEGKLSGRLRLTAPRAFSDLLLGDTLAQFAADHPDLELEMALSDSRTDVMAGGFDLALRITLQLEDTSLIARKLADISNICVASPDFLVRHGMPEKPTDLTGLPAIYYANLSAAKQWQFKGPSGPEAVRVQGKLMSNSGVVQKELAIRGQGVAILPKFFLTEAITNGSLVPILEDTPPLSSSLYALYPERRHNPVRVRRMIDCIATALKRDDIAARL